MIDAYAGSGATAIPIAEQGSRVVAIEADRDAAARCASLLRGGSRAITGRVEDELAGALPADVVIVNPPRVGLHERVSATLQEASPAPRAIIYVSCDPATLGRDLARMPRYKIAVAARIRHVPADGARRDGVRARARRGGCGMKYRVRIGNEDHEVLLDGDGVHIDGEDVAAQVDARRRHAGAHGDDRRRSASRRRAPRGVGGPLHALARRTSVRGRGARRTDAGDSRSVGRGGGPERPRATPRADARSRRACQRRRSATRCRRGRGSS